MVRMRLIEQDGELMGRLGRQGPEIPLRVVIAQAAVRTPLLGMDEALELHGVAYEKTGLLFPTIPRLCLFLIENDDAK